jgi:DNA-binding CsgD family transcriptional regulator
MSNLQNVLIQKGLSNRQAQIAELVSTGLSNREISNQLLLTEKGVKWHLSNIYTKMHVKSRAQLIVWCLPYLGYVEDTEDTTTYTQAQLDAMSEADINGVIDTLVGEAESFDMNKNLVGPYIDAALKFNRLSKGLMVRRNYDGVSEVGWLLQKMIGEVLSEGKAKI